MKKRFTRQILFAALLAASLAAASHAAMERTETYPPGLFTDVSESSWYEDSVITTYEYGILNGNAFGSRGSDAFGPLSCVGKRKSAFFRNKRRLV